MWLAITDRCGRRYQAALSHSLFGSVGSGVEALAIQVEQRG
jgi:hypothetical protein